MFLLQKSIEIGQVKRIEVFKTSNLKKFKLPLVLAKSSNLKTS